MRYKITGRSEKEVRKRIEDERNRTPGLKVVVEPREVRYGGHYLTIKWIAEVERPSKKGEIK